MKLLIKNARLVQPDASQWADVLLADGKIAEVAASIAANDAEVIDAAHMLLFPGGIDPHVHLHLPVAAGFSADDFQTGSRAALAGGTTTLIDFVTPARAQSLVKALELRLAEAENCHCDYSFHISPVDWHPTLPDEIRECVTMGFPSFKVYMAYLQTIGVEEDTLMRIMKAVAKAGGLMAVHCETGRELDELRNSFAEQGFNSPLFHPRSRPAYTESNAVKTLIDLVAKTNCPVYIVHVSTADSLRHIQKAQQAGMPVFAETCPHYLLFSEKQYEGEFDQAAPFVMSPPLRPEHHIEALWQAIADRTIQSIGTDHCPFQMSQKREGRHDFRLIPNGVGGIEERMLLLYHFGVNSGRISIERFVELTSSSAASIFSLNNKGRIVAGADADLVLWDPQRKKTISAARHSSQCDHSIYEGISVTGSPAIVIKRGKVVLNDDMFLPDVKGNCLFRGPRAV